MPAEDEIVGVPPPIEEEVAELPPPLLLPQGTTGLKNIGEIFVSKEKKAGVVRSSCALQLRRRGSDSHALVAAGTACGS